MPSYEIAKAWFALGDDQQAQLFLQRAFAQRSHSLVFLRVDPQLAEQQTNADFLQLAAGVKP